MKGKEGNGGFLESILMVGSVNAAKQDFFFFSSRRRHTRSKRDWSSDVCLFRSTCTGSGFEHVEMQFLSDVYIRCPDCDGKRFRPEILEIKLVPTGRPQAKAKSIADVLAMTVSEAMGYFAGYPEVLRGLEPLTAVGLSYVKLGQPVPTL